MARAKCLLFVTVYTGVLETPARGPETVREGLPGIPRLAAVLPVTPFPRPASVKPAATDAKISSCNKRAPRRAPNAQMKIAEKTTISLLFFLYLKFLYLYSGPRECDRPSIRNLRKKKKKDCRFLVYLKPRDLFWRALFGP